MSGRRYTLRDGGRVVLRPSRRGGCTMATDTQRVPMRLESSLGEVEQTLGPVTLVEREVECAACEGVGQVGGLTRPTVLCAPCLGEGVLWEVCSG